MKRILEAHPRQQTHYRQAGFILSNTIRSSLPVHFRLIDPLIVASGFGEILETTIKHIHTPRFVLPCVTLHGGFIFICWGEKEREQSKINLLEEK